jgi:hypothetical protein
MLVVVTGVVMLVIVAFVFVRGLGLGGLLLVV